MSLVINPSLCICLYALGLLNSLHRLKPTSDFLLDVMVLRDVLAANHKDDATMQVVVPRVVPPHPKVVSIAINAFDEYASMKTMCVALHRKGPASFITAEEYGSRFESNNVVDVSGNLNG